MRKFMAVVDTYPGSCQMCNEVEWVGQIAVAGSLLCGTVCSRCLSRLAEEVEHRARLLGEAEAAHAIPPVGAGAACPEEGDLDQLMEEPAGGAVEESGSPAVVEAPRRRRWPRVGLIGAACGCCAIAFTAALWIGQGAERRWLPPGSPDTAVITEPPGPGVSGRLTEPQIPAAIPVASVSPRRVTKTGAGRARPVVEVRLPAREQPAPKRDLGGSERQTHQLPLNVSYSAPRTESAPPSPPPSETSRQPIREDPPTAPEAAPLTWAQPVS